MVNTEHTGLGSLKKTGIISQVRMGSNRLPGKVLLPMGEGSALSLHIKRLEEANIPVYIATTEEASDDVIEGFCIDNRIPFFRGSTHDVLSRFYHTAKKFELDVIVRVTSDCPLIDGSLICEGLNKYFKIEDDGHYLYLSNCLKRSYPRGVDFEIFDFALLERTYYRAVDKHEREHVTPYMYSLKDDKIALCSIQSDDNNSNIRITLDEEADYLLLKKLVEEFNASTLNYRQIVKLFKDNSELFVINQGVKQKKG